MTLVLLVLRLAMAYREFQHDDLPLAGVFLTVAVIRLIWFAPWCAAAGSASPRSPKAKRSARRPRIGFPISTVLRPDPGLLRGAADT